MDAYIRTYRYSSCIFLYTVAVFYLTSPVSYVAIAIATPLAIALVVHVATTNVYTYMLIRILEYE